VKQDKVYHLYFPILFFMGDTMEHNKLCILYGDPKATYVCCICQSGVVLGELWGLGYHMGRQGQDAGMGT